MTMDISRKSFDPRKGYSGVLMQQGRVQLDADWNEGIAIEDRRWRSETVDLVGEAGIPDSTPDAFRIGIDGGELTIAPGRAYLDGMQPENHGAPDRVFDPVLEEMRGTQPVPFSEQPFRIDVEADPPEAGRHLVYLDVWRRDVTYIEDPDLLERAVGVDTAARWQTVWQVRVFAVADGVTCATPEADIDGWPDHVRPSDGRLSTAPAGVSGPDDPCLLPPTGGYRALENRTYLVAIHDQGPDGRFRFKWSRYNGTVVTRVIATPALDTLVVASVGRDEVLRFNPGDWVEVIDDRLEFEGTPGLVRRVQSVDDATRTVVLESGLASGTFPTQDADGNLDPDRHTRLRRWDQSGEVRDSENDLLVDLDAPGAEGLIPLPEPGRSLILEDGVQVSFSLADPVAGRFHPGDYWIFVARTVDAYVEPLDAAPPVGIHHHFLRLAVVDATATSYVGTPLDCRPHIPPRGAGCCTVVVPPGEDVQSAVDSLPDAGGCVCLKTGLHVVREALRIERGRVHLHGESPGSRLQRVGGITVLAVGDPAGALVESVRIDGIRFECPEVVDTGAITPMIEVDFCSDVRITDCVLQGPGTSGVAGVQGTATSALTVEGCALSALAYGVYVTDWSQSPVVRGCVLESAGEAQVLGIIGVLVEQTIDAARIEDNRLDGYLVGVAVDDAALGGGQPSSQADGSIVRGNRVRRPPSGLQGGGALLFAIQVAARGARIADNRLSYSDAAFGGIRVTGQGARVEGNLVRCDAKSLATPASVGIQIGYADPDVAVAAADVAVVGNEIRGPQHALVAYETDGVSIEGNRIDSDAPLGFGVVLFGVGHAHVVANRITDAVFPIAANGGSAYRILNNDIERGSTGISLYDGRSITCAHNRLSDLDFYGMLVALMLERVELSGNRVVRCGGSASLAVGIGVLFVYGELLVEGCEVMDVGVTPAGARAAATAWGIYGDLVLEAHVSGNLVTTSNIGALDVNAEDRALRLRGLIEWRVVLANQTVTAGFGAQVLGNRFTGVGRTALVEFDQFRITDNINVRFERVMVSDNDCMHGTTGVDETRATVLLAGSRAIVMGNHLKATVPGYFSVDFRNVPGTYVGNFTSGPTLHFADFPNPENNFNRF